MPALAASGELEKAVAVEGITMESAWEVPRNMTVEIAVVRNRPPAMVRRRKNRTKQKSANIIESATAIKADTSAALTPRGASLLMKDSLRADQNKNAAMTAVTMNSQKYMRGRTGRFSRGTAIHSTSFDGLQAGVFTLLFCDDDVLNM